MNNDGTGGRVPTTAEAVASQLLDDLGDGSDSDSGLLPGFFDPDS
jgi:hypothetical protein